MQRLILILAVFGAALALAGCGGDDETSPPTATTTTESETTNTTSTTTDTTPTTTEEEPPGPIVVRIVVVNAAPKGGIVRETVNKGDRVVLSVRSDVADEVHLHGYDISRNVAAGGTARIRFRATVPGRFEVELEQRSVQIADLTVNP